MAVDNMFDTSAPVPMAYPNLIEPKKFKDAKGNEQGDAKFRGTFIFDPASEDFKALKDMAIAVAKDKFPNLDLSTAYRDGKFRMPWVSGDKRIEKRADKLSQKDRDYDGALDYAKGKMLVTADTKTNRPQLAYINNGRVIDLQDDAAVQLNKGKFYSGVEAFATFNLVAYDGIGEYGVPGVKAYLQVVVSTGKGKQIGGMTASQRFSGYVGKMSDVDPTEDDEVL